jgi:hypothetical protein
MKIRTTLATLVFCVLPALLFAQEFRAMISGSVTDPSGGAVAGATVTATNLSTNSQTIVRAGSDGNYVLPQLAPGRYELTVEGAGFQKYTRSGITLNIGDKASVQIRLEMGKLTESVTVNAELTGIEQNQSVMGQLMDNKKVSELPLNGRQVFMLLQLSAGVVFTQQQFGASGFSGTRAWDINGNYTIHGSRPNTNAFLLDGAPLGVDGKWDYAPLVDAVEEFKVTAAASDASHGLTGGGVINMTMKGGTNQIHGLASEFIRNNIFDALATQTNRAAAQSPYLKNQQHQWNSFAAMISGPIIKNKFFYSGNYEGYRERTPFPVTNSVPTLEQRAGDFSRTFNAAGGLTVIYDPLTTRQSGNNFVRDPFSENRVPAQRIVPVAKNILGYVPVPNIVTNPVTNLNNFASSPNIGEYGYDSFYMKFDYNWNSKHRSFGSHTQNHGQEFRTQTGFPKGNPAKYGPDPNRRAHYAATLDHVWTATPSTVVTGRLAWDRYYFKRDLASTENFDGSGLGFTGRMGANPVQHFPSLTMTNYVNLGAGVPRIFQPNDVFSIVTDVARSAGRHFLKVGLRAGQARFSRSNAGDWDGLFGFTPAFTQRDPQRGDTTSGNSVASFLLGYPASGGTDVNAESTYENKFIGVYIQDDFKISSKLLVNLGLRWDIQTPSTERFDRQLVGFDPAARYQLGPSAAQGGFVFADNNTRQAWSTHYRDLQPRLGVAYQMTPKIVWRAGYGLSFLPVNGTGGPADVQQNGYSRRTPLVATVGGGLNSFIPGQPGTGTLQNPFPTGILQPIGAGLGPRTQVGQALTYLNPDYVVPRVHQFNVGFDYELPGKVVAEFSFVGTRTRKFPVTRQTNAIPLAERLKGIDDPNYLNAAVPNPFAGAADLASTGLSAATITRSQALRPYPQFTGITVSGLNLGNTSYNALEARVNKRLSHGLAVTGTFTWSKNLEATAFREDQYELPSRVLADFDRSRHLSFHALYDLPIGRGRMVGKNWNGILNAAFGNWQYNFILESMTGTPTGMPDATPVRNPKLADGEQTFDRWFNTCTLLTNGQRSRCISTDEPITFVQLKPNELRTYSAQFPNIRDPWRAQINMSVFKVFPVRERVRIEFRAESFNAFNTPIYAGPNVNPTNPNFGVVVRDQQNFPRNMQFALRFKF